jgi:hypothetical protein
MRIEEHPFYVLGITPRSSLREIIEHAEELNVRGDPEKINECRVRVTHPAKRIDAEVSWFPGLAPSRIRQVIAILEAGSKPVSKFEGELHGDCLWAFNTLAFSLAKSSDFGAEMWELALLRLTENFQKADTGDLMATLNADRSAAGIPEVTDIAAVVSALARHEENVAAFAAERLVQSSCHGKVLTVMLQPDANGDGADPWGFIPRVVDRYQILIQSALSTFSQNAALCREKAISGAEASAQGQSKGGTRVQTAINCLEFALSKWGASARPIQLLAKSRGLRDSGSVEIATQVRGTAVRLANDFGLHQEALRITNRLYSEFGEVPELAELLERDIEALNGIIAAKEPEPCKEIRCPECGGPMVAFGESANGPNICADAGCRAVQAFLQLCTSIETKAWQQIQAHRAHAANPAAAFREGYAQYRREVSPWLAIICDSCRDSMPALMKARIAAARCLFSLAGGFIHIGDFDQALKVSGEALPLTPDDSKLEAEVTRQIQYAAESRRLETPSPQTARRPTPREQSAPPTTGSPARGAASGETHGMAPHPTPTFRSLFSGGATRNPWPLIAAPALAILVWALFFAVQGHPPETDPGGATASPMAGVAEPATPQPAAEPAPTQVAGLRPSAEPIQVSRAEPRVYTAVPLAREFVAQPQQSPEPLAAELPEPISLPNGTDITPPQGPSGLGALTISNYTGGDAAVKLKNASGGYTARFVYVCSRSDVTVSSIAPGSYVMQFATGRAWDATGQSFQRDRSFSAFDTNLAFSERPTDDGVIYSSQKVTLHEVPNGNIRKKAISAAEFDQAGTRRVP